MFLLVKPTSPGLEEPGAQRERASGAEVWTPRCGSLRQLRTARECRSRERGLERWLLGEHVAQVKTAKPRHVSFAGVRDGV